MNQARIEEIRAAALAQDGDVWRMATSADDNGGDTLGPRENSASDAARMELWVGDIRGMLSDPGAYGFVGATAVEWFAAQGVRA